MSRRGKEIEQNDFSGGLRTATAITEVGPNEAYDLSNVVIGPGGSYFRSRFGNSTFNSSAMSSGAAIQGLGYFKLNAGTEFLTAVCGAKIYESTGLDGTMNDITGAVTPTAGQNNIYTLLTFNNLQLGFGGPSTGPDAPFKYSGAGNAAALNGTPPSAYGAVQGNNRVFAFRTAASPSIVQWCKLGDPTDWTATGSGSQTISTSDNEPVTAMAVLDNSVALVFKQTSVHKMMINQFVSNAFPVFPLFKTGCAGKHAVVVANNLCYFITPNGKMQITDGISLLQEKELPQLAFVDDLWSTMSSSRLEYVQGKRVVGDDYDHIVWLMTSTSSGTTHDTALVWDIRNKCWLRHKTGWKANVIETTPTGATYTGHYAGIIYKQDVSSLTTDASESSNNIDSYWMTGWKKFGSYEKNKSVQEAYISYVTQTQGTINFSWGYDFNSLQKNVVIDEIIPGDVYDQGIYDVSVFGGQTDQISRIIPIGNGQVFQYRVRNNDYKMKINNLILLGKQFSEA
jgi:hypothetical protein